MIIAVIGAGNGCTPETYALAEAVGREIGKRGHALVCGGLNGVMEAACKGAKAFDGVTIGILPGEAPGSANSYVDVPIVTGLGYARNILVALTGQVSEIAHTLGYDKPVIGLKTWLLTRPGGEMESHILVADGPADAVEKAIAAVQGS